MFMIPILTARSEFLPALGRPALYEPLLRGKRIGLVVNQASLFRGEHAIDLLRRRGLDVRRLFALEHGVRGEGGAGEEITDGIDAPSGLPIVSLYGPAKKPARKQLAGLDVIVFDMQDVGIRFFTYISSLGLIMEAAAEQGLPLVILDRPNPNGDYVEGPVLKAQWRSFVGAFPIPVVYGMSIGELARAIHGERWQKTGGLSLSVIPMQGYRRGEVRAPEAPPSPGLRSLQAIRIYPSLALFEPTAVSVGRGTAHPFELFGAPAQFGLGSFAFVPRWAGKGEKPLHDGVECLGTEFFSRRWEDLPRFTGELFGEARRKMPAEGFMKNRRFLSLLLGDDHVAAALLAGRPWAQIRQGFSSELEAFERIRERYRLYP